MQSGTPRQLKDVYAQEKPISLATLQSVRVRPNRQLLANDTPSSIFSNSDRRFIPSSAQYPLRLDALLPPDTPLLDAGFWLELLSSVEA